MEGIDDPDCAGGYRVQETTKFYWKIERCFQVTLQSASSSDVSFDLELIGNLASGPPRLNVARFGSDLVLYWADASYRLEASDALGPDANWTAVIGAASPVSVTSAGAQEFYRLKKP